MSKNSTFIFVHVPKTGGTTFHHSYVPAAFSESERFVVSGTWPRNADDITQLIGLAPEEKRRLKLIAGHNTFGLGDHFENAKYMALFRNPYQQVLSFYLHSLHHEPEMEISKYMRSNGITLKQYVEQNLPVKFYRIQLTVWNAHFDAIKGNRRPQDLQTIEDYAGILDQIEVLGLTEKFDFFLFLIHVRFGFPLVLYNSRLIRPERASYKLSDREIAVIKHYNQIDLKLYELATQRFSEEVKAIWSDEIENSWMAYKMALAEYRQQTGGDVTIARKIASAFRYSIERRA